MRAYMTQLGGLLVLVLATLGSVLPAAAQDGAAPSRSREHPLFFATATIGLGDCGGGACQPHDPDDGIDTVDTGPFLGFGAGFFIRPIPYFAAGVFLHYQLMGADDEDRDRVNEAARYFLANLALRGILPIDRLDLFAELGLGYGWWGYTEDRADQTRTDDTTVDGLDVSLALGADYAITDQWALGGIIRFAVPDWGDRCHERIEPGETRLECLDYDALDPDDREELPDMLWYVGFTGSFRFGD